MQELLELIERVAYLNKMYRAPLADNKMLTRYVLIDIILTTLGWNVHEPSKVLVDYTKGLEAQTADYALLDQRGNPVILVISRPLNQALDETVSFNVGSSEANYLLYTDGNAWLLKRAENNQEVMSFSFANEAQNLLLIKLTCLMPVNVNLRQKAFFPGVEVDVTPINLPLAPIQKTGIASLSLPTSSDMAPSKIASLNTGVKWLPLAELTNSGAKPTRLRFPDRTSTFVTTFAAVIKELAEWLIRNKKLPFPPVIDCYNKHYVLNDAGVDRSGLPFAQSSLLSNGWSVNMDYSAGDFSKNALWLLEKAGENPDEYFFC